MKITNTILSIPPYISTSWDRISTIYVREKDLHVHLKDGSRVILHDLPAHIVEQIFSFHERSLEQQQMPKVLGEGSLSSMRLPFSPFESMAQMLQHNPKQRDLPPIPDEAVSKISQMAKMLTEEEILGMQPPDPECNCLYCQIGRILRQEMVCQEMVHKASGHAASHDELEEEVSDEELIFEEWSVQSISDKLYLVTNKLDPQEQYRVFLGDPIGCTCGKTGCEHILTVLRH